MTKNQPNELEPERFNQLPKEEVVEMLITVAKAIAQQQQATREELKQEIEKLPVSSRVRTQNLIKTAINRPTQKNVNSEIRKTRYRIKT
ncbi:MAG: hypothetical protein F6K63_23845 [Moorea sp. SIO1G6]|uniref:Uncharacterized protein n=1 Tax=Moorena producens (strain JHB) TaxID=1454205 RepID=A0A1D9G289_MOOP1|nr:MULTISPECIES: hypothetical protein [Moorena]AOY81742.2 hypothetical protein BJP36_19340 [Moorena producens JHB]NES83845.1 hypothetical protein [Moorena sp. SIO2B7]NET67253.1 hypothetical protein [Moorena sp. SIO1G6]